VMGLGLSTTSVASSKQAIEVYFDRIHPGSPLFHLDF
jgi:hypothetical protein